MDPAVLLIGFGTLAAILVGFAMLVARFYRKVNQGQALIVNKLGEQPLVTFTGATVLPIFHRAEVMDISLKTIELERRGKEGLICMDNIRADIKVTFFVRVNKTGNDVLKVAQAIGCARASDQKTLEALFIAKFSEALKTVGKRLEFVGLYEKRDVFKDHIIKVIGQDLNGYVLEDAAIDFLEQTPVESLDRDNILDAEGIRKITELTAAQAVLTNEFRQSERKAIKKQDVEAQETILELERQQADAEAKQAREIATMKARELAETEKVAAEERLKAELARIKADEEIAVNSENKQRQIEVAQKGRERVVAVETERVARDRDLEQIAREREVELQRIAKEKELEVQRKEIADVVRSRVVVEKTVAVEEEATKDVRALAEARRMKDVVVIAAEGEAQEKLVRDIKAAEAAEQAATHRAREQLTMAEAELETSNKKAQAKIRFAEGVQAEKAAEGLAQVRVLEAKATANEKLGLVDAKVTFERMQAEASGQEKKGMAGVTVQLAEADAVQKRGLAEAAVEREKLLAVAQGEQERGMARVRVEEAEAVAVEKRGLAEAVTVREKLVAEAAGLAQKAEAMKALDGVGREHEEFRLRLDKDKEIALASIGVRKDIATAQAEILKEAFSHAKINIVGGDGQFFDQFVKAVSFGTAVDGAVGSSETAQKLLGDYLSGEASLPKDLKEVLTRPAIGPDGLQKLSVAGLIGKLATGSDAGTRKKLEELVAHAKELGLTES